MRLFANCAIHDFWKFFGLIFLLLNLTGHLLSDFCDFRNLRRLLLLVFYAFYEYVVKNAIADF